MKDGDIVWICSLKKEGLFIGHATDIETGAVKCFVHIDEGESYFVSQDDLEFVETIEEAITHALCDPKDLIA